MYGLGISLSPPAHGIFFKAKRTRTSWAAEFQKETERLWCVCMYVFMLGSYDPHGFLLPKRKKNKFFGIFFLLTDKFPRNHNHNSWRVVKQGSITKVGVANQRNLESLRIEKIGMVDTHFLFL